MYKIILIGIDQIISNIEDETFNNLNLFFDKPEAEFIPFIKNISYYIYFVNAYFILLYLNIIFYI